MRYINRWPNQNRPERTSGHVYYVRLKTEKGAFYKLGFTSLNSVEARLSRSNNGDEKLIDKVLLFSYHKNAYDLEQRLHSHFFKKRVFGQYGGYDSGPLHNNGQSELYVEDILGLDKSCTPEQVKQATSEARKIVMEGRPTDYLGEALMSAAAAFMFICVLPFLIAMRIYEYFSPKEREASNRLKASDAKLELDIKKAILMLKVDNTIGQ